jgi:bifunctional ADP-heptose synthase (sugar kinase/adenylyltransferase)
MLAVLLDQEAENPTDETFSAKMLSFSSRICARSEQGTSCRRELICSSRAAGAKTVGRVAGAGKNSIARLFDHAADPV